MLNIPEFETALLDEFSIICCLACLNKVASIHTSKNQAGAPLLQYLTLQPNTYILSHFWQTLVYQINIDVGLIVLQ